MDNRTLHSRTFGARTVRGFGALCALSLVVGGFPAQAQNDNFGPAPAAGSEAAQLLSPDQLDNLVAPIALYPDQLLSEVLAASTYPLELVAAQQWLQQNGNLQGVQLMNAARQQNWDPSIQALVAFPDVMNLLTRDVQWTSALGNAFLAQQADVMNAIQRMRARAQANGRLQSSPQQVVSMQQQDGQSAIEIQPANPQMMYVPSYDPQYVWGPPAYGDYPQLGYPSAGQIFGTLVNLASFFLGFASLFSGGWGWGLSWLTHSLFLNGLFFSHFGFHGGGYGGGGFYGGGYNARSVWVHDPGHRMGVPYSNRAVASRFGGSFRAAAASGSGFGSRESFGARSSFAGANSFASRGLSGSSGWRTPGGAGGRSFESGRTSQFADNRGFSSSFNGAGNGWHSPSSGNSFGGSRAGSNYASNFGSGSRYGSSVGSGYGAGGNRGFSSYNGMSSGFRSSSPSSFGTSPRSSFAAPQRSSGNEFRASASPQRFGSQNFSQHFSAPKAQHFSAPKAQHFSAPKASRSSGSHGGGHGGGGGHSHGGSHKH